MIARRLEVSMSTEPTPPSRRDDVFEDAQRRYTPRYVEFRLRLLACPPARPRLPEDDHEELPVMYSRRPIHEDELGVNVRHTRYEGNPLEDRMGEVGLLVWAVDQLGYFAKEVVEICVISGMPYREFADLKGVSIGHISNTKKRAMEEIAFRLGYEPGEDEE